MRVGFVALADAAPLIAAEALGLFSAAGLQVELQRDIGWATIRDKIIYGELDAAQAPAPMLWSAQLGLSCPPCDVLSALVLSRHGNAITLSRALWDAGARSDPAFAALARERRHRQPLTLAVVFPYSSHHLLLREWLRSAGLRPDTDVRIVLVPPEQMFRNLAAGTVDGFCAGEPWNSLAVREGLGWCRLCSAQHAPGHVEKVLMVRRDFAEAAASQHAALVGALLQACAWCDQPENRPLVADRLARSRHLKLPLAALTPALTGRFDFGLGRVEDVPDFHVFHRGGANVPAVAQAAELQAQLVAAQLLTAEAADPTLPGRLFREDLHREFAHLTSHHAPIETTDVSGVAP